MKRWVFVTLLWQSDQLYVGCALLQFTRRGQWMWAGPAWDASCGSDIIRVAELLGSVLRRKGERDGEA